MINKDLLYIAQNINEGFPGGARAKNLPANVGDAKDSSLIPGSGRSSEQESATHSNIVAWKTPWTEEPGWLQFMGLQREAVLNNL